MEPLEVRIVRRITSKHSRPHRFLEVKLEKSVRRKLVEFPQSFDSKPILQIAELPYLQAPIVTITQWDPGPRNPTTSYV